MGTRVVIARMFLEIALANFIDATQKASDAAWRFDEVIDKSGILELDLEDQRN